MQIPDVHRPVNKTRRSDCASAVVSHELKIGPGVSVSDLHFVWIEDVFVGGVIFDFKSHCCFVVILNAFNVANRNGLRGLTGNDKQHREEKKNHEHNRTGDDGLRFHSGQHSGFGGKYPRFDCALRAVALTRNDIGINFDASCKI